MTKKSTFERVKQAIGEHSDSNYDYWLTDSTFNCLLAGADEVTTSDGNILLTFADEFIKVRMGEQLLREGETAYVTVMELARYKYDATISIKQKTATVL